MEQNKNPHENHRARMKARVKRDGLTSLAEHEALEYLLFFAIPRRDTNELAHALIEEFGSFTKVLQADEDALQRVPGIGKHSAEIIKMVYDFHRYYEVKSRRVPASLKTVEACTDYALNLEWSDRDERCYLVLLDDRFHVERTVLIGEGVPNAVSFNKAKLMREAARSNATIAFLTHNHPTGLAIPSTQDVIATDNVKLLLLDLNIRLLDHIIVARDGTFSFRSKGKI